jgi:tetratricopeptide (TPR) repeat protein
MKKTKLSLCIIFGLLTLSGCSSVHYKKANILYENLSYSEAIQKYLKIKDAGLIPEARIKIADCYLKLAKPQQAEFWYSQALKDENVCAFYKLQYARILVQNQKNEEAQIWYNNYLLDVPEDLTAKTALQNLVSVLAEAK